MNLRFAADRRSLLWSLVLFPALPTLSFLKPELAPWLLPLALYLAYCAGVLTHNHQHAPVFHGRRANAAYSAWLSFFYGCPAFVWLPTHNQNHHRYLNGAQDATQTSPHPTDDTLWAALSYPTRSAVAQARDIWRYVVEKRRRGGRHFRQIGLETAVVVLGHGAAAALAVALYGPIRGALTYALALGVPVIFSSWSMMFTNYVQHVGCDPRSPDNHSRNFVSPTMNWLVFQAGYHTVHHEHATAHWSRYPALHAQRSIGIDPSLNERTILGYCLKRYLLGHESFALDRDGLPS
jgi:beta-carotene hydroxylase